MERFVNEGFGWTCRRCLERESAREAQASPRARFFSEGEAEGHDTALSAHALARWRDASRRTLVCPNCGAEETVTELRPGSA